LPLPADLAYSPRTEKQPPEAPRYPFRFWRYQLSWAILATEQERYRGLALLALLAGTGLAWKERATLTAWYYLIAWHEPRSPTVTAGRSTLPISKKGSSRATRLP